MSWLKRVFGIESVPAVAPAAAPVKLHIGSGPLVRPGWINIDNQPYPGVDRVLDVTKGLPFENVSYIYAEHFIEHLAFDDGHAFLKSCRRALRSDGVLRLSTPNLDWVWATQYHPNQWQQPYEAIRDCFWMNKAFRGWGHQFLYNLPALTETLKAAGFENVRACRYGESGDPNLAGMERHESYEDTPEVPHVIIAEASGLRTRFSNALDEPLADYRSVIGVK